MASGRIRLTAEPERVNPVAPIHVWRSPAGSDQDIIVVASVDVYAAIYTHAQSALPNETGGFLLGHAGWDATSRVWMVQIDEAVPVEPLTQTPVHFSFSWKDVDRVRNHREEQKKALIGWYHTHPDMGIFLSETDVEKTHRVLFSEPFQLALVYDPVRGKAGYFFWEGQGTLDAGAAPWREFQIALDEPQDARQERPVHGPVEIVLDTAVRPVDPPSPPAPATDVAPLVQSFRDAAQGAKASIPTGGRPLEEPAPSVPDPDLRPSESMITRTLVSPATTLTTLTMRGRLPEPPDAAIAERGVHPAADARPSHTSAWAILIFVIGLALGGLLYLVMQR